MVQFTSDSVGRSVDWPLVSGAVSGAVHVGLCQFTSDSVSRLVDWLLVSDTYCLSAVDSIHCYSY